MDSNFFNYLQEKATQEFPGLVSILGEEEAEIEMKFRLQEERHMLHDEDLKIIGEVVVDLYRRRDV